MKQWIMVIDVERCHDCNNCFLACKDEHVDNTFPQYSLAMPRHGHRWRDIDKVERGSFPLIDVTFRPWNCMMCENAPCIDAGGGAVYRRKDGIVMIDPEKAKGRKDIAQSCPYKAIYWNDELDVPQKCTFCAHLLDEGWKETRCSQVCPTGATKFMSVEPEELEQLIIQEKLVRYHDDYGTLPRVFYKNLYRFTKHFIEGSLVKDDECCGGCFVKVTGGGKVYETVSNDFGDFRVDGLEPGSYSVSFTYPERAGKSVTVELKESVNLGDIEI